MSAWPDMPPAKPSGGWVFWAGLAFALVFPSIMGWLDYGFTPPGPADQQSATPIVYVVGKLVQFGALPILFVSLSTGRFPRPGIPSFRGAGLGLAFGALVALGAIALYYAFLRDTGVFRDSPTHIKSKLAEFGMNSPVGFVLFAVGVTVPHSLLEEYYWRWFVFGQLRRRLTLPSAVALSSAGFAAFHIFPLNAYLPGHFFSAVLPFTFCVGVGGATWAWLYERNGTVYVPWLSHLVVDSSLFVIGYDLFFVR